MQIKNSLLFLLSISLFLQCKKNDDQEMHGSETVLIEAAKGGTITLENGITLIIPAGALDRDTEIGVESLPGSAFDEFAVIGAKMEPDGLVFNSPATLQLPLPSDWDGNELPAIYEVASNDPSDFFLTGNQAGVTGSQGAYFA